MSFFTSKGIEIVKNDRFILTVLNLLFLVSPGVAFVFVFGGELFQDLEWIKLVLLSISIIAPLVFFNTLIFLAVDEIASHKVGESSLFVSFTISIMASGVLLYALIANYYFFGRSLREGLVFVFYAEILGLLTVLPLAAILEKKRLKKKVGTGSKE